MLSDVLNVLLRFSIICRRLSSCSDDKSCSGYASDSDGQKMFRFSSVGKRLMLTYRSFSVCP